MNNKLASNKILIIECRVEAGCLGPTGADLVDGFCEFASIKLQDVNTDNLNWRVVPRQSSSEPEFQYKILDKKFSRQQATKYLEMLGINIAEFESQADDQLIELIEQYMERD